MSIESRASCLVSFTGDFHSLEEKKDAIARVLVAVQSIDALTFERTRSDNSDIIEIKISGKVKSGISQIF